MKSLLLVALLALAVLPAEFPFLPAPRCADALDPAQCAAALPKEWTADERQVVAAALERLRTNQLARGILAGAAANGYRGFQRYRSDTQRTGSREYVTKFGPGFVLFNAKVIGLTDAFFELADLRDPLGGYRIGDLVLLHELVHAFDDRTLSSDAQFTARTGWTYDAGRWNYVNSVSISEYNGIFAETLTLYARGRYLDAWTRDRTYATKLRVPVPRIQSLVSPAESFADIVAHLILDSGAQAYLSPAVVQYVEQQVYPRLRETP